MMIFLTSSDARLMVDSWRPYDAWAQEYGDQAYQNLGIIGTHWRDLLDSGQLSAERVEEIADVAIGTIPARRNHEEIILYSAGGMPVEDVACATDIYRRAVEQQIGTPLNLWQSPALS